MKSATLHELKNELQQMPSQDVMELCLRLARFKKENKELLTYLLFESGNPQAFMANIKQEINEQMNDINRDSLYFVKKSLRKILRMINKYSRYCSSAALSIEMLLHFASQIKQSGIPFHQSQQLLNLYNGLITKTEKLLETLHEDLQYDYGRELEQLKQN